MPNLRLCLAVFTAKIIFLLSRFLNKGGGTAAPGLIALKIYPNLLSHFCQQLKKGTILITGTNGKTTTARLITHFLKSQKISLVHNRTGSNLARGLASACLQQSSWTGKINAEWGIFELDEAAFSPQTSQLKSRIIIILNLFRDQLDRYGEIDTTLNAWRQTIKSLPKKTLLIFNSDDPSVASLGQKAKQEVIYFGLRDHQVGQSTLSHASDATNCPHCLNNLIYQCCYISHLGIYRCPRCGKIQPQPAFSAQKISPALDSSSFLLNTPHEKLNLSLPLPGLYNLYNALAAFATLKQTGISLQKIKPPLANFQSPFGRVEKIKIKNHRFLQIFLVKNPAGFNEVLRTLKNRKKKLSLLIAINDLIADGQDVSWLWDVDFEMMTAKTKNILFSGLRAEDMALRWQYAGGKNQPCLEKNFRQAIEIGLKKIKKGETLFILPTYTAMLAIRKTLFKMGLVHETWKD